MGTDKWFIECCHCCHCGHDRCYSLHLSVFYCRVWSVYVIFLTHHFPPFPLVSNINLKVWHNLTNNLMFAAAQYVRGKQAVFSVTLTRQYSHCQPMWNARVSICGSILYKITSWQWMQAEFITHVETNKENNVRLTEWHVCSPTMAPAAASLPVSRQPAVFPSHMPPRLPHCL